MDGAGLEAAGGHRLQFLGVVGHAAARAAQRERRTHDDGVADLFGNGERLLDLRGRGRGDERLADLLHGLLEQFAVLGAVDGLHGRSQQLHAHAAQKALVVELRGDGQSRLPAKARQQAVRPLLFDDAADGLGGQGLQIDLVGGEGGRVVRGGAVGHDRRRVGVDQHHFQPRLLEHAAGLRARVVELRRLTDDDGAGADEHYLFDSVKHRHARSLPSWIQSGRRASPRPAGRRRPRGGTARKRRSSPGSPAPRRLRRWR